MLNRAAKRVAGFVHSELLVILLCAALGVWLVRPGLPWAAVAECLGICSVVVFLHSRRIVLASVAFVGLVASSLAIHASFRVLRIERAWPQTREAILASAGDALGEMLDASVELARDMADAAVNLDDTPPAEAFGRLESAVGTGGPERGVVTFDTSGSAIAWAGHQRVAPVVGRTGLTARITQFYVLLEAQRQVGARVGIGQVILLADNAVPNRAETVAEQFAERTKARVEFYDPRDAPTGAAGLFDYTLGTDTLFSIEVIPPAQGDLKLNVNAAGGRWVSLGVLATLAFFCFAASVTYRWLGAAGIAALLIFTPVGTRIGFGGVFSEATYFLDVLGPFSASAGALLALAGLCEVALPPLARRGLVTHWTAHLVAAGLVLAAPFSLSALAKGITPPTNGVGVGLWMTWETTLTVVCAVALLAAAFLVRGNRETDPPAWVTWAAMILAVCVAVLGLYIWRPSVGWPAWYAFLWLPSALLAVMPAPRIRTVAAVAVVAGAGSALLAWGAVSQGHLLMGERDADRVKEGDAVPIGYLERFGEAVLEGEAPRTTAELYSVWRHSFLSQLEYPAVLASWGPDAEEIVRLDLADLDLSSELLQIVASYHPEAIEIVHIMRPAGMIYLATVPFPDGSVLTVAVGPRSRLIEPARLARFLRGERRVRSPYEMSVGEVTSEVERADHVNWRRDGWMVRGARGFEQQPGILYALRVEVPLGNLGRSLVRGALVLVWNVFLVGMLWLLGEAINGRLTLPPAARWLAALRSYRARLTFVLAGFFMLPTLGYTAWTLQRLRGDAERSRDLLISQTLSDAAGTAGQFVDAEPGELRELLVDLARRLNADLFWYDDGELQHASPPVLAELGLLDHFMPPAVYSGNELWQESEVTVTVSVGGHATRMGYRHFGGPSGAGGTLAAPRLVDVRGILTEQEDLFFGLLLATLVGLAAAATLSALAARSLAYPVRLLRDAADAVGAGKQLPPFGPGVPAEFVSVVEAFERMAKDIDLSQSALEAARQRTATVLKNVATGVVALDQSMRVTTANPRAEELLSAPLPPGAHIHALGGVEWVPVWKWVRGFLNGRADSDAAEFTIREAQIRAQIAAMHGESSGCVLALDDTTELARAVRVIAWGELARQIAHEIKNPLTPIRLGMQHLTRVYGDPRGDFGGTLDRTARQILAEIERLDSIARAFARFGAPLAESAPLAADDLVVIARETAELYKFGGEMSVQVVASGPVAAKVRKDEVKEVLVNLIENARDAGATEVRISVEGGGPKRPSIVVTDDGNGIPREDLPHVFEPQFSTTTSGTGLGLAICKRLVESWGGEIQLESEVGKGTVVRMVL